MQVPLDDELDEDELELELVLELDEDELELEELPPLLDPLPPPQAATVAAVPAEARNTSARRLSNLRSRIVFRSKPRPRSWSSIS
jgi:hypothetical protein